MNVHREVIYKLRDKILNLGYYGTNAETSTYSSAFDGKFLGERGAVLGVKYNF